METKLIFFFLTTQSNKSNSSKNKKRFQLCPTLTPHIRNVPPMNIHATTLLESVPNKHQSKQCYGTRRAGSGGGNILQRGSLSSLYPHYQLQEERSANFGSFLPAQLALSLKLMGSAECQGLHFKNIRK